MLKQEQITIEGLRKTIKSLNYKWFEDQINMIAIRTKEQIPDVFNDYLCLVWKVQDIPSEISNTELQKWLNLCGFTDTLGNPLLEDGKIGAKTNEALEQHKELLGKEVLSVFIVTTEPGVYYQKHLLNKDGCWVMMPNQMLNAYKLGFHQNKSDHRALRSVGRIFGLREDDKDGILLNDKDAKPFWIDGHLVGSNIHGAKKLAKTLIVHTFSAGCTVHEDWQSKEEMCDIAEIYKNVNNGLITYTLINEDDYLKNL